MRKTYLIHLVFLISYLFADIANAKEIYVSIQKDFDCIATSIESRLKSNDKNISIILKPGIYTFTSGQIALKDLHYPDAIISIKAINAKIVSAGESAKSPTSKTYTYLTSKNSYYDPWSKSYKCDGKVEICNKVTGLCRVKNIPNLKPIEKPEHKYIRITCWFTTYSGTITKVDKDYIYFNGGSYAKAKSESMYNVNMDYDYAHEFPYFQVFGWNRTDETLYVCKSSKLIDIANCSFKKISVSGIEVYGSSSSNALISFDNLKVRECRFSDNTFYGIGGAVIQIENTDNVTICNNTFSHFRGHGVTADNLSSGLRVYENCFEEGGINRGNKHCVLVRGNNFSISRNTFHNFAYSAISVGVHYSKEAQEPCSGIISQNEIYYSGNYLTSPHEYTAMDSGAIYCYTQTSGVVIENNYIHDITGRRHNRGIFCDDGAKNITIRNNIITRIHNSYCIDSRNVTSVAKRVPDHNTGNICEDNLVDGEVRFYIKDKSSKEVGTTKISSRKAKQTKVYKMWNRTT